MTLFGLFLILGLILLIPTAYAAKIGAPYAPTRGRAIAKAFDQVGVGQGDKVVDLGTGDGKVLLAAAQRQAQAIGFELSPIMWIIAYLRCLRKKNIKVRYQNFFKATLPEDTTYIFCFLMPQNMPQVKTILKPSTYPPRKPSSHTCFL